MKAWQRSRRSIEGQSAKSRVDTSARSPALEDTLPVRLYGQVCADIRLLAGNARRAYGVHRQADLRPYSQISHQPVPVPLDPGSLTNTAMFQCSELAKVNTALPAQQ